MIQSQGSVTNKNIFLSFFSISDQVRLEEQLITETKDLATVCYVDVSVIYLDLGILAPAARAETKVAHELSSTKFCPIQSG